jgi:hypothetical protein
MCTLYLILALLCSTRGVHGMMSTLRNRAYATTQAIRRLPTNLYARFYSGMYRTPATRQTVQQPRQAPSMMPQIQQRAFHATPATPSSPSKTIFQKIKGWFATDTSPAMFNTVERFLQNGSGYNELLQQIKNGTYNAHLNATKWWTTFADETPNNATILDMLLSRLVRFDRFGKHFELYFTKESNIPLPIFTDFFDVATTPHLVILIRTLLMHGANTSFLLPIDLLLHLAEAYGFIQNVVTPPQEYKQQFLDYLKDIHDIAHLLYEKADKTDPYTTLLMRGKSFETFFMNTVAKSGISRDIRQRLKSFQKAGTTQRDAPPEFRREQGGGQAGGGKKLAIDSMFNTVERFLQDGSDYNELLQQIKNGTYNAHLNEKRSWTTFADKTPNNATILDMLLSRLMRFDRFGKHFELYFTKESNIPLPIFTDFFDAKTTPHLVMLIRTLLAQGANTAYLIPAHLFSYLAEAYGFIQKVVTPPQEYKQQFLDYLKDIHDIAHLLYEKADKTDPYMKAEMRGKSFATYFDDEAQKSFIPQIIRNRLANKRFQHIIDLLNAGDYEKVLTMINNGIIDDIVSAVRTVDYFFAGPCEEFKEKKDLSFLETLLRMILKTRTIRNPLELKTKKWPDLFDPAVTPKLLPIIQALVHKTVLRDEQLVSLPLDTIESLIACVVIIEAFVTPPTDPHTAQQYKHYVQTLKQIIEDMFVRMKQTNEFAALLQSPFSFYITRAKQKYNIAANYEWKQSERSEERSRRQPRPPSAEKREEALKILGFAPNTHPTKDEILSNHAKLIRQYHPDIVGPEGLKKAQFINAARDVLIPK